MLWATLLSVLLPRLRFVIFLVASFTFNFSSPFQIFNPQWRHFLKLSFDSRAGRSQLLSRNFIQTLMATCCTRSERRLTRMSLRRTKRPFQGNSSNMSDTLPGATSSCIPWRTTDLKYANNEVYVDLVEEMDAIVNRDGVLVKCEIYGEVEVNSYLSGVPDLTLSFANPSILDDVRFHPCVRFCPWESQQILSFVPPDEQFKLISYR
ncbi:AP-3 complex subunit mu-like isoform X2 [Prunus dulcis]|nr:AP-3 complex subunit mu-like isoform X2 [Prunus dulcis]